MIDDGPDARLARIAAALVEIQNNLTQVGNPVESFRYRYEKAVADLGRALREQQS